MSEHYVLAKRFLGPDGEEVPTEAHAILLVMRLAEDEGFAPVREDIIRKLAVTLVQIARAGLSRMA